MILINFVKLVYDFTPERLRKPRLLALLECIVLRLTGAYTDFQAFAVRKKREASYTCQTMSLEKALNDRWPDADGAIYINNSWNDIPQNHIYREEDEKEDLVIYREVDAVDEPFIYREEDYALGYDFEVKVPADLVFDEAEMRALLDLYKKAGKRYIITTI